MLEEKLKHYRNSLTSVIDKLGGTDLLDKFELDLLKKFKTNPFVELIEISLMELDYSLLERKLKVYISNRGEFATLNENNNLKLLLCNYIRYKLELQGIYCVYDEINDNLKIKI